MSAVIWPMHKQHGKFSEKAKVGTGSDRRGPRHQRVSHTLQTALLPDLDLACTPPPWYPPIPAAPTSPSQSRLGGHLSCSKGNKRPQPQPRKGVPVSAREGRRGRRAPALMLKASYRLWSSPPPAEPRCFPPSSHSSSGTQGAGAGLESRRPRGVC